MFSLVHFAWMLGLQLFANEWVLRIKPLKVSHFFCRADSNCVLVLSTFLLGRSRAPTRAMRWIPGPRWKPLDLERSVTWRSSDLPGSLRTRFGQSTFGCLELLTCFGQPLLLPGSLDFLLADPLSFAR